MFGMQINMVPKTVIVLPEKEVSSASSVKSGKSGKSGKSIEGLADNQSTHNSTTTPNKFGGLFKSNSIRSASISSGVSGTPSSHQRGMGAVTEEDSKQPYQPEPLDLESYRQCLHWLQQTCRPVFMKELTQVNDVPVPITEENAKHPDLIGESMQVQVGSWKQSQVQLVPIDRWGDPQDVLHEVSELNCSDVNFTP